MKGGPGPPFLRRYVVTGAARFGFGVESSSFPPTPRSGRSRNQRPRSRKLSQGDGALLRGAIAGNAEPGEADQHQRPGRGFGNRRQPKCPDPKLLGVRREFAIGIASRRRSLLKEAENIDALASGGLEGNAGGADKGKTVGEHLVRGAPERARAGDLAAVNDPGDGVDVKDARASCR